MVKSQKRTLLFQLQVCHQKCFFFQKKKRFVWLLVRNVCVTATKPQQNRFFAKGSYMVHITGEVCRCYLRRVSRVGRDTRYMYNKANGIKLGNTKFHLAINSNQAGREVRVSKEPISRAKGK